MVFDDDHFALWERGRGSTNASLADGTKVTIFIRNPSLREAGLLPLGGIARFYGTAQIYKSGPIYEEIWKRLVEPEKKSDPEKKGFGVLIKVERSEDLSGTPLAISSFTRLFDASARPRKGTCPGLGMGVGPKISIERKPFTMSAVCDLVESFTDEFPGPIFDRMRPAPRAHQADNR
jgi:hypothetical protein